MNQPIFRPAALERLASPEQLDQLMRVTTPRNWIALSAIAILLAGVLIWSAVGSVTTNVNAAGILIRSSGTLNVVALQAGEVTQVPVRRGDTLGRDQVVATVRSPEGRLSSVTTSFPGRVIEVLISPGDWVTPGRPLLNIENTDEPLEGLFYVPASIADSIAPGMPVRITVQPYTAGGDGFLLGTVQSIAPFPSTRLGMTALLENETLVTALFQAADSAPVQVEVILARAPTPSGFEWSVGNGPGAELRGGLLADAEIRLAQTRPITLVLPFLQ